MSDWQPMSEEEAELVLTDLRLSDPDFYEAFCRMMMEHGDKIPDSVIAALRSTGRITTQDMREAK